MRTGRVVYGKINDQRYLGQVTKITSDGLVVKTSVAGEETFFPVGSVHKLRALTLKQLISEFGATLDAEGLKFLTGPGGETITIPIENFPSSLNLEPFIMDALKVPIGDQSVPNPTKYTAYQNTQENLGPTEEEIEEYGSPDDYDADDIED